MSFLVMGGYIFIVRIFEVMRRRKILVIMYFTDSLEDLNLYSLRIYGVLPNNRSAQIKMKITVIFFL